MRPLILMPTINSRNSNACYLQLLSVQRCQHPPQAELCFPRDVAMRSPLPFPCVPDHPYKILLVQVGTLSFSHP